MKKKYYNCPAVELITLQAEYKFCQTQAVSDNLDTNGTPIPDDPANGI